MSQIINYDYYDEARFGKLNLWKMNFCLRKIDFPHFLSYLIEKYK